MRWHPFFLGFLRTLFILYCVEAGAFLILAPWRDLWVHFVTSQFGAAQEWLLHPVLRSAVTGFGIVHLVWGVHDLEELLRRRNAARTEKAL